MLLAEINNNLMITFSDLVIFALGPRLCAVHNRLSVFYTPETEFNTHAVFSRAYYEK